MSYLAAFVIVVVVLIVAYFSLAGFAVHSLTAIFGPSSDTRSTGSPDSLDPVTFALIQSEANAFTRGVAHGGSSSSGKRR